MHTKLIKVLVSCSLIGGMVYEAPARELFHQLKGKASSNIKKVKDQMMHSCSEFKRLLESLQAMLEDLSNDISREEDKTVVQTKLEAIKLKVRELRTTLNNNMRRMQITFLKTYKELAMNPKELEAYADPDAFWTDKGLAAANGKNNFRGSAEKIKYVNDRKSAYDVIIKNARQGIKGMKNLLKNKNQLSSAICYKLIEKDFEEINPRLDKGFELLNELKSSLSDISAFSNSNSDKNIDKINALSKNYKDLETTIALLSQIKFFDDILGIKEWTK